MKTNQQGEKKMYKLSFRKNNIVSLTSPKSNQNIAKYFKTENGFELYSLNMNKFIGATFNKKEAKKLIHNFACNSKDYYGGQNLKNLF